MQSHCLEFSSDSLTALPTSHMEQNPKSTHKQVQTFFADAPLTFTLTLHIQSLPNRYCNSQPKIRSTCTADKICGERRVHLHLHIFLTPMLFTPETQQRNPFKSSSEGIEAFTYHPITLFHAPGLDIQCENSAKSSIYPQSSIRKSESSAHAESR